MGSATTARAASWTARRQPERDASRVSATTEHTWLALARARVVRSLAILQSVVVIATIAGVLTFTSMTWFVALGVGLTLSIAVNLVLLRFSRAELQRER